MKRMIVVLAFVGLLIALSGCATLTAATPDEEGEIRIDLTDYDFNPNVIRLKAGQKVTFVVSNQGDKMHEIMIGRDINIEGNLTEGFHEDFFAGITPEINGPGMVMGLEGGDMEHDMEGMAEGEMTEMEHDMDEMAEGEMEEMDHDDEMAEGDMEEMDHDEEMAEGDMEEMDHDDEMAEGDMEEMDHDEEMAEGDMEEMDHDDEMAEGDMEEMDHDEEMAEGDMEEMDHDEEMAEGEMEEMAHDEMAEGEMAEMGHDDEMAEGEMEEMAHDEMAEDEEHDDAMEHDIDEMAEGEMEEMDQDDEMAEGEEHNDEMEHAMDEMAEGDMEHDMEGMEHDMIETSFGALQRPLMDAHAGLMVMFDPTMIPANEVTTITFTVPEDKVGEWELGCFQEQGQHYDDGMRGTLIVEPSS